MTYIVDYLFY